VWFPTYDKLGDNVRKDTGISTAKYTCGIVGMAAYDGDIQENGDGDILLAYMYEEGNTWRIRADFRTHGDNEDWTVKLMCIDKAYNAGFTARKFGNLGNNVNQDTGVSSGDYVCGVVGMAARDGDIQESGDGTIWLARTVSSGGKWHIQADFRSHGDHESWDVNTLCVKKETAAPYARQPWVHRTLSNLGDNVRYDTGLSSRDYICGVVGWAALNGDIQENDDGDILRTYTFIDNNRWHVRADFRSHGDDEDWTVDILCASREFASLGAPR
jgi:hypothetical protein